MTAYAISALGVCIGITTGILGAGPSILTILLLERAVGLPIGSSIATSLVVVAGMSLVALVPCALAGDVLWRPAVTFAATSMTGAYLGGRLSALMPPKVLLVLFLLATVAAGLAMISPAPSPDEGRSCTPRHHVVLAVGGLLVGSVTGLVGLGGGFAVVPLLVVGARVPVRAAVGTSVMVIAMNTLAALAGHLPHPAIHWQTAAYLGAAEAAGSLVGVRLAVRVSAKLLRRAFAVLMLVAAVGMLAGALRG